MKHASALAGAAVLALALQGCATKPLLAERLVSSRAIELAQTPFFPQTEHQCGPAALATMLAAEGMKITPKRIEPLVYVPGREGSLQAEMTAAVRHFGRVPLPVDRGLPQLAASLAEGKPVLVLQNLAFDLWPAWHYAVVIGIDPERDEVILRSGSEKRLVMSAQKFLISWKRSDYWGLTVASPKQPPAGADPETWIKSVSDLEQGGARKAALQAYEAAALRWPQQALVWQALGNARYQAGNRKTAITAYRRALELAPTPETYNNLAFALGESGCVSAARGLLDQGRVAAHGTPWAGRLEQTAREVDAMKPRKCRY